MSFHVLQVLQHGAILAKEQGFIVCRAPDKTERKLPHEDIRAGIALSGAWGIAELRGIGRALS